jgi:hypothetical protein
MSQRRSEATSRLGRDQQSAVSFGIWNLLGIWNLESGIWNLEFGIWNLEQ